MGTVLDSAQDFYSSRLATKARKGSLSQQLMADADLKQVSPLKPPTVESHCLRAGRPK
jgi:hypothetical protein